MSRVKVNEITNKVATGPVDFPDGITGVALTVTGNVTVGGTIISEDTTNVDSVGWVTARSGLNVGPPSTGIGATIHSNGNAVFAGIATVGGNFYVGAGSAKVGVNSTSPNEALDVVGHIAIQGGNNRLLITSGSYRSDKGAFLSTPTGNLLQAFVNAAGSLAFPLLTGNLPSGAIERVCV